MWLDESQKENLSGITSQSDKNSHNIHIEGYNINTNSKL